MVVDSLVLANGPVRRAVDSEEVQGVAEVVPGGNSHSFRSSHASMEDEEGLCGSHSAVALHTDDNLATVVAALVVEVGVARKAGAVRMAC